MDEWNDITKDVVVEAIMNNSDYKFSNNVERLYDEVFNTCNRMNTNEYTQFENEFDKESINDKEISNEKRNRIIYECDTDFGKVFLIDFEDEISQIKNRKNAYYNSKLIGLQMPPHSFSINDSWIASIKYGDLLSSFPKSSKPCFDNILTLMSKSLLIGDFDPKPRNIIVNNKSEYYRIDVHSYDDLYYKFLHEVRRIFYEYNKNPDSNGKRIFNELLSWRAFDIALFVTIVADYLEFELPSGLECLLNYSIQNMPMYSFDSPLNGDLSELHSHGYPWKSYCEYFNLY